MAEPLVNVVIATFNRRDLLVKAVRSALAQEGVAVEVLVCDDGSTDGSREAVESLGDARVRWISGPRAGRPAVPRNRGLREARGRWVAFLDDDDVWLPGKLAKQLPAILDGALAVGTNARRVDRGGKDLGLLHADLPAKVDLDSLALSNRVVASSALVDRALLMECGGFPESPRLRALEDFALWLRVACLTDWVLLPEALVEYRDGGASLRALDAPDTWAERRRVFFDLFAWGWRSGNRRARAKGWDQWRIATKRRWPE